MFLHPTNILLKFFPIVVGYLLFQTTIVPCHQTVTVLDVLHHFVITSFLIP